MKTQLTAVNEITEENVITEETQLNELIEKIVSSENSKSSKIKELYTLDLNISEIAKKLNIRYNFAYNVISNNANITGIAMKSNNSISKKNQIIELFQDNKSSKEIAITLKTNINYIYKVIKEFKENEELENFKKEELAAK